MKSTKRKLRKHHGRNHRLGTWAATPYTLLDEMAASTTAPLPEAMRTYQLNRMQEGLAALERQAAAIEVLSHRSMVCCHRMTAKRIAGILRGDKKAGDVVVVSV